MTSAAKTIVYASYVSPFPGNSGERIRALNLIAALRFLGYRVEAIVGNYDGIDLEQRSGDGVHYRQIPFAWPRLRQAASVYFRPHRGFVEQIQAIHRATPVTAIILDYGFMGAQISPLMQLGIPVLLGTHNLESAITGQIPQPSLADMLSIRLRQSIESVHERWFFRRADSVICVSEEDRLAHARFVAADRLHMIPNFIDIPDRYGNADRQNRIIMTGSFSNFQNVEGLRWFLDEVWDEELQSRASFCVAGKMSDRVVQEFPGVPGLVGLGPQDDLLQEIAQSRCAIVPLWHGGGTRLKCLEAMAARTPVVTTSKGCEGIGHNGAFRVADDATTFKSAILGFLNNPASARDAAGLGRAVFDRHYSLAANAARLDEAIASAVRSRSRHTELSA